MFEAPLPDLIESDAENLPGQSDEDTGRGHLSHSAITSLLSSPREYELSYEQKLEPVETPAPLHMGKAFQLAIEHSDPQVGFDAIYDAAPVFSPEDEAKRQIQAVTVRSASALYLEKYPVQDKSIKEYEYRVKLRNPWTGHYSRTFDLLGFADEVSFNNPVTVTENKFVGQISALKVRTLPLDRQVALECYGIWRATGKEVKHVKYRWTRKPSIKQRKNETLQDYLARLEADYFERPDFYLVEESIYRSTDDLVRIEAELWIWADQVRAYRRHKFWPRNTDRVSDFGGSRFLPVLLGDPDAESLYRKKEPRVSQQEGTSP